MGSNIPKGKKGVIWVTLNNDPKLTYSDLLKLFPDIPRGTISSSTAAWRRRNDKPAKKPSPKPLTEKQLAKIADEQIEKQVEAEMKQFMDNLNWVLARLKYLEILSAKWRKIAERVIDQVNSSREGG